MQRQAGLQRVTGDGGKGLDGPSPFSAKQKIVEKEGLGS